MSSIPMTDLKFLTVTEIADVMRVSKMTVYRLIHDKTLKSVRIGRSFRVLESDVLAYLEAGSDPE